MPSSLPYLLLATFFNLISQTEKLYVLSLKERSDKQDAIALAASLTGLDIEFWDSTSGEDIVEKVLPPVYTPFYSHQLS
jgi:hypothetical protein